MKKPKIAYFYSQKFPQHGLRQFEVTDEIFLTGKTINKTLNYLVTNYDFSMYRCKDNSDWISIYIDFDDEEILMHEDTLNRYIISYNKEKIEQLFKKAIDRKEKDLLRDLERIEKIKGEKFYEED